MNYIVAPLVSGMITILLAVITSKKQSSSLLLQKILVNLLLSSLILYLIFKCLNIQLETDKDFGEAFSLFLTLFFSGMLSTLLNIVLLSKIFNRKQGYFEDFINWNINHSYYKIKKLDKKEQDKELINLISQSSEENNSLTSDLCSFILQKLKKAPIHDYKNEIKKEFIKQEITAQIDFTVLKFVIFAVVSLILLIPISPLSNKKVNLFNQGTRVNIEGHIYFVDKNTKFNFLYSEEKAKSKKKNKLDYETPAYLILNKGSKIKIPEGEILREGELSDDINNNYFLFKEAKLSTSEHTKIKLVEEKEAKILEDTEIKALSIELSNIDFSLYFAYYIIGIIIVLEIVFGIIRAIYLQKRISYFCKIFE